MKTGGPVSSANGKPAAGRGSICFFTGGPEGDAAPRPEPVLL
jgi:hypothetical protein